MTDLSWLTARPIAHRGLHDLNRACWENTLSAFARAADKGYAIECDVHLTLDGVPVVFHDHELQRLAGQDGYIWQRTAAEMAALRIGGTADHAPTLDEVLKLVNGRVPLVIELKGTPGRDEGLVAAVARRLENYRGKAAIMSFDHWLVASFPGSAGHPGGLTACGTRNQDIEAQFRHARARHRLLSYAAGDCRTLHHLRARKSGDAVITCTVRDQPAVDLTFRYAYQLTFEGFEPQTPPRVSAACARRDRA